MKLIKTGMVKNIKYFCIPFAAQLPGAICLLILLQTQMAAASPSFDCSLAKSMGEQLICGSDTLQQLDVELAGLYKAQYKKYPKSEQQWLKESQRHWLKSRNSNSEEILALMYQQRISELKAGIIRRSFALNKLPVEIDYANAFRISVSAEQKEEGDAHYARMNVLLQGQQVGQQLLKEVEAVADSQGEYGSYIDSIEVMLSTIDHNLLLVIHSFEKSYRGADLTRSTYYIQAANGQFKEALEISGGGGRYSDASMPEPYYDTFGYWQRDKTTGHLQFLKITEQKGGIADNLQNVFKSIVDIDFKAGAVSTMDAPLFAKGLEPPFDQAVVQQYFALLKRLLAENRGDKMDSPDASRCTVLSDAISDAGAFHKSMAGNGITWSQFIYGAARLGNQAGKADVQERLILLAQELMRYKAVIETTPEWREKIQNMLDGWGDERLERFEEHEGFPSLNQCDAYPSIDGWIYAFWSRRLMNKQFDLTGEILTAGLKSLNRAYRFDDGTMPQAVSSRTDQDG